MDFSGFKYWHDPGFKEAALLGAGLQGHEAAQRAFEFAVGAARFHGKMAPDDVYDWLIDIAEVILGDNA